MKKKVLLLIALLLPLMVGAKKLTYLGHQYDGKVNGQNIPEGKGKIDIGGLIIEGMFNGKTINDATFKTEWLKFDGTITYDRDDEITLKQGGSLTMYYYIREEIRPLVMGNYKLQLSLNNMAGKTKSTIEKLNEDMIVNRNSLIKMTLKLPFTFEMKGVPSELNPPLTVSKKAEYELGKYEIYGQHYGDDGMYAYLVSSDQESQCFVKDYKDNEGRSWTYVGSYDASFIGGGKREMQFIVTYPDGSQYVSNGNWLLVYPDSKYMKYINGSYTSNKLLLPINGKTYKEGEGVTVKKIGDIAELSDFLRYNLEKQKITLQSGVAIIVPESKKNMSVSEMEKYLQDNLFSIVQTSNLFAANIYVSDRPDMDIEEHSQYCIGRYVDGKYVPNSK